MRTITLGLLGLGTVGSGVVKLLQSQQAKLEQTANAHFVLKTVAVHHLAKHVNDPLPAGTKLTDQIDDVINDQNIQVVIETMGTIDLARKVIEQAIYHGKSIITANKDLLATDGPRLADLASDRHVDFMYEASVAGGIPILRVLSNSLVTDQINQVTGIINGTANYILTAMNDQGWTYADALKAAQDKGYAEPDPTNDVKGIDTANKLSILSQFAFGRALAPQTLDIHGIDQISATQLTLARQLGYTTKLLAIAKRVANTIYTFVGPACLTQDDQLAQVAGVQNAIAVNSAALGTTVYTGPGAGAEPTANSILSDLVAVADHIENFDCGKEFNGYHNHLASQHLAEVPQACLVTIPKLKESPKVNFDWVKVTADEAGWGGITPALDPDQRIELKENLATLSDQVQFLPIANSWVIPSASQS